MWSVILFAFPTLFNVKETAIRYDDYEPIFIDRLTVAGEIPEELAA